MTDYHSAFTQKEAMRLVIGDKKIGEGAFREVYEHAYNPHWVVKIESKEHNFANVIEWEVWNQFEHSRWSGWLAPCLHISPCGGVLIQAKTVPVMDMADLPKKVPAFFSDLKRENWGKLKGRIVCHDYGNILMGTGTKMTEASWVR